ncbi:hypothetical protein V6N12_064672 [Hibiscus sabdariffa]|uniref:Uncharacterized protein n=1 Tax=Hibiscus sabdariffa TaxID=183260 RepID=A0ABR2G6Q0_9ROSI
MKTTTLCNVDLDEDVCIFWPLQFNTLSVAKTAPEPLNPSTGELYLDSIMKDLGSCILSCIPTANTFPIRKRKP